MVRARNFGIVLGFDFDISMVFENDLPPCAVTPTLCKILLVVHSDISKTYWVFDTCRNVIKISIFNLQRLREQKTISIYVLFEGNNPVSWFQHVRDDSESIHDKIGNHLEWIVEENGTGYAKWLTDFDHKSPKQVLPAFEKVGNMVNDLRNAISDSHNKYIQG